MARENSTKSYKGLLIKVIATSGINLSNLFQKKILPTTQYFPEKMSIYILTCHCISIWIRANT